MSEILLTEQASSSVTPTAGRVVIYAKTDGYLYFKDDTGQETRVNMQVVKTAAQWVSSNPVLAEGVFGVESDTMKFKIGDGVTQWNTLAYWRYTAEHLTINTAGGDTVLTLAQARASSFAITGALVSNANIIVQNTMALFVAENLTSGAHTVTFKTATGTGIAVPQGAHVTLYADGVNVENPVTAGPGAGDVVGPASSVNGKVAVFSGTTGKLISDSGITLGTAAASATTDFAAALGVNDNYVTDTEKTVVGNTSGTNTGDNATNTQYSGLATSKQDTLVSATNIKTVNSTTLLGSGNISVEVAGAAATAETNAKAYADTLVVGLWDDRGAYDASVNTFPASGGSGTAGVILKGDIWVIGAAGTLGGVSVGIGDTVRALTNTPGQIISSWALQENNIGYVPENVTNKVTSLSGASTDTQYPSAKLAYDQLSSKAPLASPTFTGTVGGITAAMVGAPSGSGTSSGTNTGDQTSIAGITGTLAQFNTAVTDADLLGTTGVGSDLTLARIAGSTYSTIQHWRNNMASAGIISGGVMSDVGGGNINVTGGSCAIRPTTSHTSTLYFSDFPVNNGIAIPANTIRYVGVEYNAGSPIIAIRATDDFDYMTNFPLGVVTNEAGVLHLHTADRHDIADADSHVAERFERTASFARDEVVGGLILGETGTRNVTVSAGALWQKLTKIIITAFNSSTGSIFDIYYRDAASSFVKVPAATQWPNTQYDNGTGTLATLASNKYAVCWFYLEADDSDIIMLYGRAEHGSVAAAEAEAPPATVPNRVTAGARILGKLVFQKSAATASSISSVFTTSFSTTGASVHSNLSNLDYASAGHTGFVADTMKGVANGVASLDANALIPVTQLPPAALERLVVVADQAARYALTITSVQNGDTVKQTDTGEMWYVVDQANLGNSAGYVVYTAGTASAVAVGGVTGLGTGVATFLATPTLANFNTALSDADVATGGGTATGANTGDQTATTVANTPAGSIAATTVQAAINELDTEKAALAGATFTGAVHSSSATGGVSVLDQIGSARPHVTSAADTSTTIAGSVAAHIIANRDTTTNNTAQLGFAAQSSASTTLYSSAAISCIFGARTSGQYASGALVFSTSTSVGFAPTEKMRIDPAGNVTITGTVSVGTTVPSAYSAWKHIFIGATGELCGTDGTQVLLEQNAYLRADAGAYVYKIAGVASQLQLTGRDLNFYSAASGAAGDPITFGTPHFSIAGGTGAVTINGTLSLTGASSTLGYGTGAGGAVTQLTSKSTTVTLNKPTGAITLEATTSIGAGQIAAFQVNNSLVVATDFVHIERVSNGSSYSYQVWVDSVSAGSFIVIVKNYTAGALAESLVLRFLITSSANT